MKGKSSKGDSSRVGMKVSGNPDVFKEAEAKKRGGKVKKQHKVDGDKPRHRMDKPHRASGGRVGADKSPLSSAHRTTKTGERAGGQPD